MAAAIDTTAIAAIIIGLGGTVAAMALPLRYPRLPTWAVELSWWGGLLLMAAGFSYLLYQWAMPGYAAKLEPRHLLIAGIGGVALFAIVAVVGLIWQQVRNDVPSGPVIVAVPSAPSQLPAASSLNLIPNDIPTVPISNADRIARFIQLKGLIRDAKRIKDSIGPAGEGVKRAVIGPGFGPGSRIPQAYWNDMTARLKEINGKAYTNRPINVETVDPSYLAFPVPGEEKIGNDVETARNYRIAHYLTEAVVKQADALIQDMERESSSIEIAIKETPAGKAIGD